MVLPELPGQNENPWFEKRSNFDLAVKGEIEGRLSEAELDATIEAYVPAASTTVRGTVELATTAEATAGTDATRAITAAGVKAVGDTKAPLSHTHAQSDVTGLTAALASKAALAHTHTAGNVTDFSTAADARVNALVPPASLTVAGKVELATSAEALLGTDAARALSPSTLAAVLNALATSDRGLIAGDDGRSFRIVAAPLRNMGSGWAVISDTGHLPTGITSVSNDGTSITVGHSIGATKVVGSAVVIDDSLAGLISVGASVGLSQSVLTLRRRTHLADYLSYTGSAWASLNGMMAVTAFSAGVATVEHENVFTPEKGGNSAVINVTGRAGTGGAYRYSVAASGWGNASLAVEVRSNSNALVATPDATMRFAVDRGTYVETVDPNDVNNATYPGGNIWFMAILEV